MFKRYPFIKQDGIKDCGVVSLLMIIKYYQGDINIEQLRELSKTTKSGTTAYHLIETALQLGFDAKGVKCKLTDLNKDNIILPVIAHVTIDNSYNHYIVIYEINFRKKYILIADPASKIKKMSFSDFEKIWNNVLIFLYPITNIPIYKNTTTPNQLIINILKNIKKYLKIIFFLSFILMIFSIFNSYYFKYMIDGILINKSQNYLVYLFFLFLIIALLKTLIDFFRNQILIYIKQKVDMNITFDTFKQIILLPYNYYCNRTTGEIISRINDLDVVKNMFSKILFNLIIDLPLTFISFILLYIINSKLFFIAFVIFILYILNTILFKPIFEKYIEKIQVKKGVITSYMVENISGFETIKGLNIQNQVIDKFERKYISFLNSIKKFDEYINYQYFIKEIINNLGFIIIIFYGGILVLENEITLGTLLTFNTLLVYFLEPIRNIIDLDSNYKEVKNALKRINDLFYFKEETGLLEEKIDGNIKINNLSFSYDDKYYSLKNIFLEIKKGEKVLIIGDSGSGKSTLLKLLMKYHEINRTQIFINNIDINDYKINIYQKGISYISQNEILYNASLFDNLNLFDENQEKVLKIAEFCEVNKILKNNLGYKMLIEENGNNISGGEKQRIVLARTLLKPFNILLIDEGFSQLDVNIERRILKRIFKNYNDKTIIIVSHRFNNNDLFDKVIKLKNGVVKEVLIKNV